MGSGWIVEASQIDDDPKSERSWQDALGGRTGQTDEGIGVGESSRRGVGRNRDGRVGGCPVSSCQCRVRVRYWHSRWPHGTAVALRAAAVGCCTMGQAGRLASGMLMPETVPEENMRIT